MISQASWLRWRKRLRRPAYWPARQARQWDFREPRDLPTVEFWARAFRSRDQYSPHDKPRACHLVRSDCVPLQASGRFRNTTAFGPIFQSDVSYSAQFAPIRTQLLSCGALRRHYGNNGSEIATISRSGNGPKSTSGGQPVSGNLGASG